MHRSVLCTLLSVLTLTSQIFAVPVRSTSLQKVWKDSYFDAKVEEEPLYAYVYEYEDDGNQIWSDCSQDQSVMKIKEISLYPNPPQKGEPVIVSLKATLYEQVDGGTVAVLIKYRGIITVINKLFKICDLAKQVEKTCPIDEGNHQVTVTETFPSYAPSGTYVGVITARDSSGKTIACVNLDISLS